MVWPILSSNVKTAMSNNICDVITFEACVLNVQFSSSNSELYCIPTTTGTFTLPEPVIGDIRLVPYIDPGLTGFYEVLIYNSDGIHKPDFGGICADSSYEEEAKVICQQMGFEYKGFQTR